MPYSPSLRVIPYTPHHQDSIISLFVNGMHDNLSASRDETTLEAIRTLLTKAVPALRSPPPSLLLYVAVTCSNTAIAMGGLQCSDTDVANNTAELTRISVAPDWRGKGVCRLVVGQLVRVAVTKYGVKSVYLITMESVTTAVRAYQKLGFCMEGGGGEVPELVRMVMDVEENGWWKGAETLRSTS